jgi:hypothetical protein
MSNDAVPAAEPVKCSRCKRNLTSLASRLAGKGARCAAIDAATAGLKPEQADKALELIADGGIAKVRKGVYRVTSSDGESTYLTSVTGSCNCPHGLRAKTVARCYHVAAVRLTARPAIRRALRRNQFAKAA